MLAIVRVSYSTRLTASAFASAFTGAASSASIGASRCNFRHSRYFSTMTDFDTDSDYDTDSDTEDAELLLPFRPWKEPVWRSHGDYQEDAWLEEHIGGPLYAQQKDLPRMPLPTIEESLKRFLPSALPFVKNQQEQEALNKAVQDFPKQAAHLQNRLIERARAYQDSSWLQQLWNTGTHLNTRKFLRLGHQSPFHLLHDAGEENDSHVNTNTNVERGAQVLQATAQFRYLVCSGRLLADQHTKAKGGKTTTTYRCTSQYKYLFHACRIPQVGGTDGYNLHDPTVYHHVVVARKGYFFGVNFASPTTGEPYPLKVLQQSLEECIHLADLMERQGIPKVGILTSNDRDQWAQAQNELLDQGGAFVAQDLHEIESACVLLCLDDEDVFDQQQMSELCLFGGRKDSQCNRWFGKAVQIIISRNGKIGLQYEHAMMDGSVVGRYAKCLTEHTTACMKDKDGDVGMAGTEPSVVKPLFLDIHENVTDIGRLVTEAKEFHQQRVRDHAMVCLRSSYGSDAMKQWRFPPDAFTQVAIQLANYKLVGRCVATYEAGRTSHFLHGRTENIRSASLESLRFAEAMCSEEFVSKEQKLKLFRDAVAHHRSLTKRVNEARGVDRHFFALSMMVQDSDEKEPDLFLQPSFNESKRWALNTSHTSAPKGAGYGPMTPGGVAVCYRVLPTYSIFTVATRKQDHCGDEFCRYLEQSFLEIQALCEDSVA